MRSSDSGAAGGDVQEGKYGATFALRYNSGRSCVCILRDIAASAFSYLRLGCVGLHLYEGRCQRREKQWLPENFAGKAKGDMCACARARLTRTSSPLFS